MTGRPVERAAREAERSRPFQLLARAGFAASGLVHLLIGLIAVRLAFGDGGDADQSGAVRELAANPLGAAVLWVLVVALGALGLWQLVQTATVRADGAGERWAKRALEAGKAVVFLALGGLALTVALGGRVDSEDAAESWSARLLDAPGGAFLLAAVGVGVGAGGIVFVVIGMRRSFREQLRVPSGATGRAIVGLGVAGYVAKGAALVIVGVLLVVASATGDAETAGGIDGALKALLALPWGGALVAVAGVGILAYGVFLFARARYARL